MKSKRQRLKRVLDLREQALEKRARALAQSESQLKLARDERVHESEQLQVAEKYREDLTSGLIDVGSWVEAEQWLAQKKKDLGRASGRVAEAETSVQHALHGVPDREEAHRAARREASQPRNSAREPPRTAANRRICATHQQARRRLKGHAMNGSELSRTLLGDGKTPSAREDANKERKELERWASLVAGCLQNASPLQPSTLGLGALESIEGVPAGWRSSVESLTPDFGAVGDGQLANTVAPGGGASASNDEQRIQVRVRTEEFGEIALIVERVESGLRVLLGAENSNGVSALTRQCQAVRRVLESGGQSVGSLEIVRMNGLGTDLAESKLAASNRARRPRGSAESDPTPGMRKKKTKRLDVIG
jgi:flagellar biosynthesis chaperone FliJ